MYLVPPMDDEPPPAYVVFVADHLAELRRETARLVGGDAEGSHLYMDVLADIAGHWRRLCWRSRLTGRDASGDYLRRRLANRTKQWREDQIYEVDVRVLPPVPSYAPIRDRASLALRKAALLPGTERAGVGPVADAGIAWVHAYRRQQWHRLGRLIAGSILLVGGIIQYVSWLSASYSPT
jgi:hypothetical protein